MKWNTVQSITGISVTFSGPEEMGRFVRELQKDMHWGNEFDILLPGTSRRLCDFDFGDLESGFLEFEVKLDFGGWMTPGLFRMYFTDGIRWDQMTFWIECKNDLRDDSFRILERVCERLTRLDGLDSLVGKDVQVFVQQTERVSTIGKADLRVWVAGELGYYKNDAPCNGYIIRNKTSDAYVTFCEEHVLKVTKNIITVSYATVSA